LGVNDAITAIADPRTQNYLPYIWNGQLRSSDSSFRGYVRQISGIKVNSWPVSTSLKASGRIRLDNVESFVAKIIEKSSRAVLVVQFDSTEIENCKEFCAAYEGLFSWFLVFACFLVYVFVFVVFVVCWLLLLVFTSVAFSCAWFTWFTWCWLLALVLWEPTVVGSCVFFLALMPE
jgi:hypothetical protein